MDLLVSAVDFEIAPYLSRLKKAGGHTIQTLHCGIGPLNSSESAAEIARRAKEKRVVFVGTAGIFGTFLGPEAFHVCGVSWVPTSDRLGQSYSIKGLYQDIEWTKKCAGGKNLNLKKAWAICGPSISLVGDTNDRLKQLIPSQTILENLELYSVARAVVGVSKSFDCVLVTTNTVGPNAHAEWKMNFKLAANVTGEILSNHFS